MEDTWCERIPLECSTPMMLSCIGREIQKEIRRNSISLATGQKRKGSPMNVDEKNQKKKYNSSNDIPDYVNDEHTPKKDTEVEGDQNHEIEEGKEQNEFKSTTTTDGNTKEIKKDKIMKQNEKNTNVNEAKNVSDLNTKVKRK